MSIESYALNSSLEKYTENLLNFYKVSKEQGKNHLISTNGYSIIFFDISKNIKNKIKE